MSLQDDITAFRRRLGESDYLNAKRAMDLRNIPALSYSEVTLKSAGFKPIPPPNYPAVLLNDTLLPIHYPDCLMYPSFGAYPSSDLPSTIRATDYNGYFLGITLVLTGEYTYTGAVTGNPTGEGVDETTVTISRIDGRWHASAMVMSSGELVPVDYGYSEALFYNYGELVAEGAFVISLNDSFSYYPNIGIDEDDYGPAYVLDGIKIFYRQQSRFVPAPLADNGIFNLWTNPILPEAPSLGVTYFYYDDTTYKWTLVGSDGTFTKDGSQSSPTGTYGPHTIT